MRLHVTARVEPHFASVVNRLRRIRGGRDYPESKWTLSSVGESIGLINRGSQVQALQGPLSGNSISENDGWDSSLLFRTGAGV